MWHADARRRRAPPPPPSSSLAETFSGARRKSTLAQIILLCLQNQSSGGLWAMGPKSVYDLELGTVGVCVECAHNAYDAHSQEKFREMKGSPKTLS